jgi:hypothetical protein
LASSLASGGLSAIGQSLNEPCSVLSTKPPSGPGWVHEPKRRAAAGEWQSWRRRAMTESSEPPIGQASDHRVPISPCTAGDRRSPPLRRASRLIASTRASVGLRQRQQIAIDPAEPCRGLGEDLARLCRAEMPELGSGNMGGSRCALLLPAARPLFWKTNRRHSGHK